MKTKSSPTARNNIIKVDLKKISQGSHCPKCGKPTRHKYRPFCSIRCSQIDLGHWLNGDYRVPVNEYDNIDDLENEESD